MAKATNKRFIKSLLRISETRNLSSKYKVTMIEILNNVKKGRKIS